MIEEHDLDAALGAVAAADARASEAQAPAAWRGLAARRHRMSMRRQWIRIGTAAAATLVIGFGLGRWSQGPSGGVDLAEPAVAGAAAWSPMMVDLQARSRTLLHDVSAADAEPAPTWQPLASELLWATRRLLDDPGVQAAGERQLLDDLEAVLTQVLDLSSDDDPFELRLVRRSITSTRLLDRLATPAAAVPS